MDYQQARQIRNMPSLSELIRREAAYGGQGVVGSVKEALKQKFNVKRRLQASMLGVKEKLDPMNWARKLFGRTGAALYGRAFGRSEEDIQYFAGRARPIGGRTYQIGETPKYRGYGPTGTAGGEGVVNKKTISILSDMYKFLKITQEQEIRRRELLANKREEYQLEDERRHKELLDAIRGKTKTTSTKIDTKQGDSPFSGLRGLVESVIGDAFKWIVDLKTYVPLIIDFFKMGGGLLKNILSFAGSNLFKLFMANPALLALASLGALAAFIIKNASAEANQQSAEGLAKAGDVSTEAAAIMATQEPTDENLVYKRKVRLLADRPSNKKSLLFWKDAELQKKYLEEIGFDPKVGLTENEKLQGFNALDDDANPIRKEMPSATKVSPSVPAAQTPPQTQTETSPPPVAPVAASASVATLSTEGQNLKLQSKFNTESPTVVNQQNAATSQQTPARNKLPPVRNQEPTFKRMIYESTKVV